MEESFDRIAEGVRLGNSFRCLYICPSWPEAREVFNAFRERFKDVAHFSDARVIATFKSGAVVIFGGCKTLAQAKTRYGGAAFSNVEFGPDFESRWELEEGTEDFLIGEANNLGKVS